MKKRLDVFLTEKGLSESREKAKAMIMAGLVFVNSQKQDKPGFSVNEDDRIEIKEGALPFVSRGGLKLQKAISEFGFKLDDMVCMDIGASTGGFTDCMLQSGAKKVYAIDVGYGQLAWKLRNDSRVVCLERTNIRYITEEQVPETVDFASIDVSFISLTYVLPVLYNFLKENGSVVCLVKPQFEAGKDKVGKKGVVREISTHKEVVKKIVDFSLENGFSPLGLSYSPIKGPEGNIEYLLLLRKCPFNYDLSFNIDMVVEESHIKLNGSEKNEGIINTQSK